MTRNLSIRRLIVTLLLLMGPLTQFQTLYACELMTHDHDEHERPSMVCCCDPGDMDVMGSDQTGMMDEACEVSYEPSQISQASGTSTQSHQVLLLDAAQPPPMLVLLNYPDIVAVKNGVHFKPDSSPPLTDKSVYSLTNRFRI